MKTLVEILQEEIEGIQDLLEAGDKLIIESMSVRLEQTSLLVDAAGAPTWLGTEISALSPQAVAAILGARHAAKD